jgi:hypothetical protein
MQPPLDAAARLLFGATPNAGLIRVVGRPRATVRSWISGRRRPPVIILKVVRDLLRQLAIDACVTAAELDIAIMRREGEPKPLRGCCAVGEDKHRRRGNWRR